MKQMEENLYNTILQEQKNFRIAEAFITTASSESDIIYIDDPLDEPTHTVIYTTYENFLHNTHREDCTITCEEDRELIVEDIMNEGGFDIQFIKLTWCPND